MKYTILFIFLSTAGSLYAQEQVYEEIRIDSILSCRFPGKAFSSNTDSSAVYEYEAGYMSYKITKDRTLVIDKSKAGFDSSLQDYERVAVNTMPFKFRHSSTDTIIGGTKGVFIKFYEPPKDPPFQKLFIFFTVKDSFTYTIYTLVRTESVETDKKVNWFYSNLKFTKNYYEALPDHDFTRSQFWGKILGYVIVLIVLGFLMGSFFKKKVNSQ